MTPTATWSRRTKATAGLPAISSGSAGIHRATARIASSCAIPALQPTRVTSRSSNVTHRQAHDLCLRSLLDIIDFPGESAFAHDEDAIRHTKHLRQFRADHQDGL